MKSILLVFCLCICATQLCVGFRTYAQFKKYCDDNPNRVASDDQIARDHKLYESISGISSQALDDFKSIPKKQCLVYEPLKVVTYEIFKDVKKSDGTINADDVVEYLKKYGFPVSYQEDNLRDIEQIPSDQLESSRRDRLITFLKGFRKEATLDAVKASLAYLYGTA